MQITETLRLAEPKDLPALFAQMGSFYRESPYSGHEFDLDGAEEFISKTILDYRNNLYLVSVSDDFVVGFLIAYKTKLPYLKDYIAAELGWYIEPKYRSKARAAEMLNAYEAWAKAVGCKIAQVSKLTTSGPVDLLYRRRGYSEVETAYKKEL